MSEEKTKEPTEKRLEDARQRGEVAKSTDLTGAVCLFSTVIVLMVAQDFIQTHLIEIMHAVLNFVPGKHENLDLINALQKISFSAIVLILLFAVIGSVSGIVALLPQVGFAVTMTPVTPNPEVCNPANGFKRIFSLKALGELVRSLVKAVLIVLVMWKTIILLFPLVTHSVTQPLHIVMQVAWSLLMKLLLVSTVLFCIIGAADYGFQKWFFMRQHRMSEEEIKQEYKEMEGDPHIKGERKKLAREIAFSPSLKKAISTSTVMVTNPTHYAVALRYSAQDQRVPHVMAKGHGKSAAKMRRMARQAGLPIIANPKIARSLYAIPVQGSIPKELFETIAVILVWVDEVGAKRKDQENVH